MENRKPKISIVFGTRPEAIKLCPLVLALREHPNLTIHVCVTGQHREMLDQVLKVFGVVPDIDFALMQSNQTLGGLTSKAINALDFYLADFKPDLVIVQGDTTTVFSAALAAFYHHIPVGHVEAGLRTWNKRSPFPEEINRVLTSHLADIHFAPTEVSKNNLVREGIDAEKILITGNTVIDALFLALEKIRVNPPKIDGLPNFLQPMTNSSPDQSKVVLITGHRRENFGSGFRNICNAIAALAKKFPTVHFIYPVHLNPNVLDPVKKNLGIHLRNNVHLIKPLEYLDFVALMDRSYLILTDSGGIQEEAPSLGKPVLVMRDTTERPEAIEMGTVKLVGTNKKEIISNVNQLLTDSEAYSNMANAVNPYGDGKACSRIISGCMQLLDEEYRV